MIWKKHEFLSFLREILGWNVDFWVKNEGYKVNLQ
jgi:hypothetical protein